MKVGDSFYKLMWMLIVLLTIGCKERQYPPPSKFVVLGRGFTNQVELGMTLRQVENLRPRLIVMTKRRWNLPFAPVLSHGVVDTELGVQFVVNGRDVPISRLVLEVGTKSTNRFNGTLSCGLDFSRSKPILRSEVIETLGAPVVSGKLIGGALNKGENVSWQISETTESLLYPSRGIYFLLIDGKVDVITLVEPVLKDVEAGAGNGGID